MFRWVYDLTNNSQLSWLNVQKAIERVNRQESKTVELQIKPPYSLITPDLRVYIPGALRLSYWSLNVEACSRVVDPSPPCQLAPRIRSCIYWEVYPR
jgi:hypothetical protein